MRVGRPEVQDCPGEWHIILLGLRLGTWSHELHIGTNVRTRINFNVLCRRALGREILLRLGNHKLEDFIRLGHADDGIVEGEIRTIEGRGFRVEERPRLRLNISISFLTFFKKSSSLKVKVSST